MHHGALQATAGLPLVNSTTDTPCRLPCELPETTAGAKAGVATGRLMIHHQNRSSHKVWRLWPWLLLQPTAVHQVNLPFSYYHRSKGTSLPHQLDTRSHTTCERHSSFARQTEWKKHKLCLCFPHSHTYMSTRKDDKPTVCLYRRQWNPCHMDFGLVPASH